MTMVSAWNRILLFNKFSGQLTRFVDWLNYGAHGIRALVHTFELEAFMHSLKARQIMRAQKLLTHSRFPQRNKDTPSWTPQMLR